MTRTIKIGTRGSPLAMAQATMVAAELKRLHAGLKVVLVQIRTAGDRIKGADALRRAGKGVFVKELERALIARRIDLAVHSLKDLPSELPRGLAVGAYLPREEAADAFVGRGTAGIDSLPGGAVIGTSSLRRQAFLRAAMPNLDFEELRGNLDTRLAKLRAKGSIYSGIIVAAAGLRRLYGENAPAHHLLDKTLIVPAAGQGTIALELRAKDAAIRALVAPLDHPPSAIAATAERLLQRRLEGGCQLPLGIHAVASDDGRLRITGALASLDGRKLLRESVTGPVADLEDLVSSLEALLREQGAAEILEGIAPRTRRRPAKRKKR